MNSKYVGIGLITIVIIILLIVLIPGGKVNDSDTPPLSDETEGFVPEEIVAIHSFENGTHRLNGEVDLPTPCHTLVHEVMIAESFPEQVTINFETEVDDDIVCAQVITPAQFDITFEASEEATIRTRFNGTSVPLNDIAPNPLGEDSAE